MKNTTDEILTVKEAAKFLRVSISKLRRLSASGEIEYIKLGDKQNSKVLYDKADLRKFLEKHKKNISEQTRKLRATRKR